MNHDCLILKTEGTCNFENNLKPETSNDITADRKREKSIFTVISQRLFVIQFNF